MHRFAALALVAFAAVAGIVASGGRASAGSLLSNLEARACEDPYILAKIRDRFRHQTRNVPHLPDVDITDFRGIHEHRYLPYAEDWPIARRYCGATADALRRERPHDLVPDRGRHGLCRHRRQCRILRFRLRPLDGLQRTLPHPALNDSRL